MKVTAILEDSLIEEVVKFTHGRNITDSLKIALEEWLKLEKIRRLNKRLSGSPLQFRSDFDAASNRERNRRGR